MQKQNTHRAKKRIEGLNVPRTKLIEGAFDDDKDFINLNEDEDSQREMWMQKEQHNKTPHI